MVELLLLRVRVRVGVGVRDRARARARVSARQPPLASLAALTTLHRLTPHRARGFDVRWR